jgi:hypothetical protein
VSQDRSSTPERDGCPERPEDVREWMWHMDLHLTEHDERHAGLALRAAWPRVREWLETVERYWMNVRAALPVSVPNKGRWPYASFYNGYWYVRRSHAERLIAQSERGERFIRCVWVVEREWGYGKAMRVVASDHPRFTVGSRFDFGFLDIAVTEGYRVLIDSVAPHVKHDMEVQRAERR